MVPGSRTLLGKRRRPEIGSDKVFYGPSGELSLLPPDFASSTPLNLDEDGSRPRGIKKRERESSEDHEFLMPSNDEGGSTLILDLSLLVTGSKLPDTWSRGGASIDTDSLRWNKGMITRADLLGPPLGTPIISGGAGHWLATPIPQPTIGAADTQEDIFLKFAEYGKILAQSRKQFQSTIEHLLANVVPPSFILPSPLSPTAGSFAAQVLENPDCSCFVDLATQMATIGLTSAKNAMGKSSEIATDASKSLAKIRVLAKDKRFPVPASAVGLPGAAGQSIDAGNRLRAIRSHDPEAIVSAKEIGLPGAAGQLLDASNRLRAMRLLKPDAIVSAKEIGLPGVAGQALDAAVERRNDYWEELDNLGIVFDIKQRGKQQQENVSPERTLNFLESQYAQTRDVRTKSFVVFQKAVDDPDKWHEFPDGHFIAHTLAAVGLNDSSSSRNAFTALDSRGLPPAPIPSGRSATQGNCPVCGKEMRTYHIERHKKSASCVKRQKRNMENV